MGYMEYKYMEHKYVGNASGWMQYKNDVSNFAFFRRVVYIKKDNVLKDNVLEISVNQWSNRNKLNYSFVILLAKMM